MDPINRHYFALYGPDYIPDVPVFVLTVNGVEHKWYRLKEYVRKDIEQIVDISEIEEGQSLFIKSEIMLKSILNTNTKSIDIKIALA